MTASRDSASTPMMRQYLALKERHPDAVLFFRMGDFYEMFFSDAELAARELGLTLTTRDKAKENAVPMAGVPWHSAESYIAKLVRKGHRVAVCEQMTDPREAKGIVEREVVEIVTPGTAINEDLVPESANNYAAALHPVGDRVGLAAVDVGTGEFLVETIELDRLHDDLSRLPISEWVLAEEGEASILPTGAAAPVRRPAWWFEEAGGRRRIEERFGSGAMDDIRDREFAPAWGAAGALLEYLGEVRGDRLEHLARPKRFGTRGFMVLDAVTRRNLELTAPILDGGRESTLLGVLDHTVTSLGARRLRAWIERPLLDLDAIRARHDAVEELAARPELAEGLGEALRGFRDLERLLGKAASGKANPREVLAIGHGAVRAPALAAVLDTARSALLAGRGRALPDLSDLGARVTEALVDEPPLAVGDGGVFRPGFHQELDALRARARGGKEWIATLQAAEREATGISSLRVGYNKVFGYYLEVTRAHAARVPPQYIRKQTLVNAERYVTPELKEEEEKILGAEEKLRSLELALFDELRREVLGRAEEIRSLAEAVGESDVLLSLARVAAAQRYVRPEMVDEPVFRVAEGRHPVVERLLPGGEFVPNDLSLDARERQIALITGPNMGGKSTFLRQTGLIAILAQMGSFVPAQTAAVGVVDRVFTRVGASDRIARGQSTFMVEMEETATILAAAGARSLVLLDEIGRGTSTYDGLSLAWAVTEHLHDRGSGRPLTLFATHYHELTVLAARMPRVLNLNVKVREWNGRVIFLHKIEPGAADRSYGIHVAELAGLPPSVIQRARAILTRLEEGRFARDPGDERAPGGQLTLFEPVAAELLEELDRVDPDTVTPLEALAILARWKKLYGGE